MPSQYEEVACLYNMLLQTVTKRLIVLQNLMVNNIHITAFQMMVLTIYNTYQTLKTLLQRGVTKLGETLMQESDSWCTITYLTCFIDFNLSKSEPGCFRISPQVYQSSLILNKWIWLTSPFIILTLASHQPQGSCSFAREQTCNTTDKMYVSMSNNIGEVQTNSI